MYLFEELLILFVLMGAGNRSSVLPFSFPFSGLVLPPNSLETAILFRYNRRYTRKSVGGWNIHNNHNEGIDNCEKWARKYLMKKTYPLTLKITPLAMKGTMQSYQQISYASILHYMYHFNSSTNHISSYIWGLVEGNPDLVGGINWFHYSSNHFFQSWKHVSDSIQMQFRIVAYWMIEC